MRKISQEEAKRWTELARNHGFVNDEGAIALGRFIVEGSSDETGYMIIEFITPCPAGLFGENLQPKTPPIMFDRTATGELIFPGRWWQHMFEELSKHAATPPERQTARIASRHVICSDAHLPADTDTISFLAPDEQGNLIVHEALPPGTRVPMEIRPKTEYELGE